MAMLPHQSSLICTCVEGWEPCALPTSYHCYVCGAALCEACGNPQLFEGAWVRVCGCGQKACFYALARVLAEKRRERHEAAKGAA
jgi:hypothetical protein